MNGLDGSCFLILRVCSRRDDPEFDLERGVYDQAELDELFGPDGDGAVDELPSGDEMGPDEINETRRQLRDGEAKRVRRKDGRVKIVAVKEFVWRRLKVGKGNDGKALNFVQRKKARLVYYCDRPSRWFGMRWRCHRRCVPAL
jgi:hypothetical protein